MQSRFSSPRIARLILIHDGLGDLPSASLGGRTPLEAAHTPCMDSLVADGRAGLLAIQANGRKPGTDIGHLALFGQDPADLRHRRGPMEAAGAGFLLRPGDVAIRFNFATIDELGIVRDRRAGRIRDTRELVRALNQIRVAEAQVFFIAGTEHRGVIVLRGAGLEPNVTDSDPGRSGLPVAPLRSRDPASERTACALRNVEMQARSILSGFPQAGAGKGSSPRPPTGIITRGAGGISSYRSIPNEYGIRVACVSGEATVLGLAGLSGFDLVYHESMTANLDTDLARKAREAASCLREYDLVYLHLKGCDIAAHDRAPESKRWFIEQTDMALEAIRGHFEPEELCVISAADHATYSHNGRHQWDPIPLFISGPGIAPDAIVKYHERACREGSLGDAPSCRFVEAVFRYAQGNPWEFPPMRTSEAAV